MRLTDQFVISLFRFSEYDRLARLPTLRSVVFLVVFLMLVSVICGLRYANLIDRAVDRAMVSMPSFVLYSGTLKVFAPMPVVLEQGGRVVVVDTSGRITPEEFVATVRSGVFVGADRLIVKQPGSTRVVFWKDLGLGQRVWTKDELEKLLDRVKPWRFLAIPVYFASKLTVKLVHVFVLSLFALAVGASMKVQYKYPELWNISLYAMVPVTVAETLRNVTGVGVHPSLWRGLYWLGAFTVVTVVLERVRRDPARNEETAGQEPGR